MNTFKQLFYKALLVMVTTVGCQKEDITFSTHASDTFYLDNEKASMRILVEGNTISKTFLIILHGGPGVSSYFYNTETISKKLEDKYAVVYWDQRNAGASQGGCNRDKLKLSQMREDLKKVIILIRYRYGEDANVFIAGHSFGGLLASAFVTHDEYQQMIQGWIVVDGTQNYRLNDSLTKQMLLREGEQQIALNKHEEEWEEIVNYCTSHLNELSYKETVKLEKYASDAEDYILGKRENLGTHSLEEYAIKDYYPVIAIALNLYYTIHSDFNRDLISAEYSSSLYKVTIPTLLIWGEYDFITPKELGEEIYEKVSSAEKEMYVAPLRGHNFMLLDGNIFCERTDEFIQKYRH